MMDLGNPTTRQRHRRSDRYTQEQTPAAPQPIAPKPDASSSAPKTKPVPQRAKSEDMPELGRQSAASMKKPVSSALPTQGTAPVRTTQPVAAQGTAQMRPAGMQSTAQMQPAQPAAAQGTAQMRPAGMQGTAPVKPAVAQGTTQMQPAQSATMQGVPPTQQTQWSQPLPQMPPAQQPMVNMGYPQQAQPAMSHMPIQQPVQRMQPPQQPQPPQGYPQPVGQTVPMPSQPPLGNTISQQQSGAYSQPQISWSQPYYAQQPTGAPVHTAPQPIPEGQGQGKPDGPGNQLYGQIPWRGVLVALILVVALIGGILGIRAAMKENQIKRYVSSYDARFCEGVYVDGIHLGGMTQQQGIEVVTNQAQQRTSNWYVRLTYQGRTVVEMDASALGMRVDVADALKRAWEQGHASNDIHERQAAMESLLEQPYNDYTVLPGGDTSVVDSVLAELRNKVYRAPQDAYLAEFDPNKTYPFTIVDEVTGMSLNTDKLREEIFRMVSTMESGELEIEPDIIQPSVTAAQVRASVALRADEYTEISTTSTVDRNKNIKRAFEKISGTILKPGDVFSFNTVVGRRTEANGFFPALEYQYNKEVEGIGGGVCQASTTMYLAAVAANLQITKHTPHSMQVGYTTFGKDATVSWVGDRQVDFAFRNNTEGNIYIVASVQFDRAISNRDIARVRIYGPYLGDGVRYKLEAEEIEFIPRTEEIRKDTKGEYDVTFTDEQVVASEGRDGHVTQSYRVKYQNGVAVERTEMFKDTYKPSPRVIYQGTQERWEW